MIFDHYKKYSPENGNFTDKYKKLIHSDYKSEVFIILEKKGITNTASKEYYITLQNFARYVKEDANYLILSMAVGMAELQEDWILLKKHLESIMIGMKENNKLRPHDTMHLESEHFNNLLKSILQEQNRTQTPFYSVHKKGTNKQQTTKIKTTKTTKTREEEMMGGGGSGGEESLDTLIQESTAINKLGGELKRYDKINTFKEYKAAVERYKEWVKKLRTYNKKINNYDAKLHRGEGEAQSLRKYVEKSKLQLDMLEELYSRINRHDAILEDKEQTQKHAMTKELIEQQEIVRDIKSDKTFKKWVLKPTQQQTLTFTDRETNLANGMTTMQVQEEKVQQVMLSKADESFIETQKQIERERLKELLEMQDKFNEAHSMVVETNQILKEDSQRIHLIAQNVSNANRNMKKGRKSLAQARSMQRGFF